MYPARLLLVDGRPEANMDCLDGPEVVLEGEEEVVAIFFFCRPLPVYGWWVYFKLCILAGIEHGSSQKKFLRQSITFHRYIIFLIESRHDH